MQTDTNSVKLVFGDPQVIAQLQEDRPHIIEGERHNCNCEHCDIERENFKCSVCGREEQDEEDITDFDHKCRSCKTLLLSVQGLKDLKALKIKSYTPTPKLLTH